MSDYIVDYSKRKKTKLFKKHELTGWIDYPGKGIITDEMVYQLIKKHSRLIDRMNNRKMVEMSIAAQLILMGVYESEKWFSDDTDWRFYGKDGFFTMPTT